MLKKILPFLILLAVLSTLALPVLAFEPTTVEIKIGVEGGGTVTIIPQVNSPSAEQSSVDVADGEVGFLVINFDEPGDYSYTILTRDEENFSPKYYTANISICVAEDNTLYASAVLVAEGAEQKSAAAIFVTKSGSETTTPDNPSPTPGPNGDNPGGNTPGGNTPGRSSQPQTGDETHLDSYLMLAIAAAAGLLLLSTIYLHNVNKMIGYKRR